MKNLLLMISIAFMWLPSVQAAPASYYDYRDGNRYLCQMEEQTLPKSCVSNCRTRRADGECIQYNSDYCDSGRNISCIPNCRTRRADGECIQYDQDFCGDNVSCISSCRTRRSDGECIQYNPDVCN